MNNRSFYQEFEASIIGRIRARIVYARLDARCKLMAEANGVVMVGANYKARDIASRVFNAYLSKASEHEKIAILEKMYQQKKGRKTLDISNVRVRRTILEMLCQDTIMDMIKKNKLTEFLSKLKSPSQ